MNVQADVQELSDELGVMERAIESARASLWGGRFSLEGQEQLLRTLHDGTKLMDEYGRRYWR